MKPIDRPSLTIIMRKKYIDRESADKIDYDNMKLIQRITHYDYVLYKERKDLQKRNN